MESRLIDKDPNASDLCLSTSIVYGQVQNKSNFNIMHLGIDSPKEDTLGKLSQGS